MGLFQFLTLSVELLETRPPTLMEGLLLHVIFDMFEKIGMIGKARRWWVIGLPP
jgi:hypothetical protein